MNDRGRLLDRGPRINDITVTFPQESTYNGLGYVVWDPAGASSPPGESDLLVVAQKIRNLVLGVDQIGCGYEAPLEAWYRFLVDPEPPAVVKPNPEGIGSTAIVEGIDTTLLAQRAAFLRPDSQLLIVMLSDEDDCSIIDGTDPSNGSFPVNHFTSQLRNNGAEFYMQSGTPACQDNPYSPDCKECYTGAAGCSPLSIEMDAPNLRCWNQKKRFGVDMLYPIKRYVDGLKSPKIRARSGAEVPNPLFAAGRSPDSVLLAGLVGVPWQYIARDKDNPAAGVKPTTGVDAVDWELIHGDPFNPDSAQRREAKDPVMRASMKPRGGTLADGSTLDNKTWNPINGHEWNPGTWDLQFSCIFRLPIPRDCSTATSSCDCAGSDLLSQNNPLCENPGGTTEPNVQYHAKAFPAPRILQVLKDAGGQAVLGSLCAAEAQDIAGGGYGYRPSNQAILEALRSRLP